MRFADAAGEALRNVATGVSRAVLIVIGLAALTLGAAWLDTSSVAATMTRADEFRAGGGSIWVVAAPGAVDGARCDALAELPRVAAAGALRSSAQGIRFAVLPSLAIESFAATPGLAEVLQPGDAVGAGTMLLSARLASDLGVDGPGWLPTTTGSIAVRGSFDYPSDGRAPILEYAAVSFARGTEPFDACWINVWPPDAELAARLRTAPLIDTADLEQVELSTINPALGTRLDPATEFLNRTTRFVGPAAGLLAALGLLAVGMRRRLEYASARHAGVTRADLVRIALIEALTWGAVLGLVQSALVWGMARAFGAGDPGVLVETAARVAAFTLAGGVLGALIVPALATERRLIELFKGRS